MDGFFVSGEHLARDYELSKGAQGLSGPLPILEGLTPHNGAGPGVNHLSLQPGGARVGAWTAGQPG